MNHHFRPALLVAATVLTLIPGAFALAGDGHDHGEAPAAVAGPALPRFAAESETFELVGVVDGSQLTLYLDRYADGSSVTDARIELDLGGTPLVAAATAHGAYVATLPQPLAPGVTPVTATILAGADSDLLAGELDIHDAAHEEEPAQRHSPQQIAGWGGAALLGLFAAGVAVRRRRGARPAQNGGAA